MLWDEPKIFFLERRYFFSIILSEFLKNRVALQLPDTPCSKELGIDITTTKPRGYYAPAGTSQEVLDLLADAIEEVTKTEEFATLVEGYGWEINFVRGSEMQPKIEAWAEELAPVFQEILNAN